MNGNERDIFAAWAPPQSPWSAWVKPVLFAHMDERGPGTVLDRSPAVAQRLSALSAAAGDAAVIVNVSGTDSLLVGLGLMDRGWRPIPLYNAAPGSNAVHNVRPMISALEGATESLLNASLSNDAPPAFLIDAGRVSTMLRVPPGRFDNRWIVLPQDFPSAACLQQHGIRRVVVIDSADVRTQSDLAHVLRRWQDGGLALERLPFREGGAIEPLTIDRPRWYRAFFERVVAMVGFRQNAAGGFGGKVPTPSQGGGFG